MSNPPPETSDPDIYTVGWICALPTELVASNAFLDEKHGLPKKVAQHDPNNYVLGRVGSHNVVMAVLPDGRYGTTSAATVASNLLNSFPNVRFGLMVGVGGGAPSAENDVRLGDVVVSRPDGWERHGGVLQYDFGAAIQGRGFQQTGLLNMPPTILSTAVSGLKVKYETDGHEFERNTEAALQKIRKRKKYSRPPIDSDRLYKSDVVHPQNSRSSCKETCGDDPFKLVRRDKRDEEEDDPAVHYGLIASANTLMKDARARDDLAAERGVLCFEMEAAGLMNDFPCLVIRGICDYSDSHKNEEWQGFAAMMAAAYAKDLLLQIPATSVEAEKPVKEVLSSIHDGVEDVRQISGEAKKAVDSMASAYRGDKIKRWLSPPDPSINANKARELRYEGTGCWLLENPTFQEWCKGAQQHLWLLGLAGCGKTVLSAAVLDHLAETDDHVVLIFFFDFNDTRKQTLEGMLRSLIYQLYSRGGDYEAQIDKLYQAHSGETQPATKTLSDTMAQVLRNSKQVFVLLDALDEATTRPALVSWIKFIADTPELGHVKMMYTSRPEKEFIRDIPAIIGEESCFETDRESINADIRTYVVRRLEESREMAKWASRPTMLIQIRDVIGSKSDGMFRWAACQLDSLEACLDPEEVEMALETLPRDLAETYSRILEDIPPARRNKAIRLLQFLLHADRPLRVEEAVDVLAIRTDSKRRGFDERDRMPDPSDIAAFCPSLISLYRTRRGPLFDEVYVWEVHLAHFSVKEYLQHGGLEGFVGVEASVNIANTCLTYLCAVVTNEGRPIYAHRLSGRAITMWTDHAATHESSSEDAARATLDFLQRIDTISLLLLLTAGQKDPQEESEHKEYKDLGKMMMLMYDGAMDRPTKCRLIFSCFLGLERTAKSLMLPSETADEYENNAIYDGVICAASYRGHSGVLKLLLDHGADINAQDISSGRTPLQIASIHGHLDAVRFLLNEGADINLQCHGEGIICSQLGDKMESFKDYEDALQCAAAAAQEQVAQLLVARGADVNALTSGGKSALYAAAEIGNPNTVRLLIDNGARVELRPGTKGVLQAAASKGHREVVQLLIARGADVNGLSHDGRSALYAAAENGELDTVKFLIDNGADIHSRPAGAMSALHSAARMGHARTVQLLLDSGMDVDGHSDNGTTALHIAAAEGMLEAIRVLVDNGADVNKKGPDGDALLLATQKNHRPSVELLINSGASAESCIAACNYADSERRGGWARLFIDEHTDDATAWHYMLTPSDDDA